jgi:hypothetical protein
VRKVTSYLPLGVVVVAPGVTGAIVVPAPAPAPAPAPLLNAPDDAWLCSVEMLAEFRDSCFCSYAIDCWSWATEALSAACVSFELFVAAASRESIRWESPSRSFFVALSDLAVSPT